jgi:hypothetical protein
MLCITLVNYWDKLKKHSLKSLYSTQMAKESRDFYKTTVVSVVSLLGEIKLYLQISLKNIENIGSEK